ncbi:MAG: DUF4258 domain-containing protein [Chloroflexi bacterium]|nr:DUF4258 domain-containing protein [Chloroflexota bacterium]
MRESGSITEYVLTEHARKEMLKRQITETVVAQVLSAPEQVETIREGRNLYQSLISFGNPPKAYLIRIFVDVDRYLPQVVTVYRTSKINKYWRAEL